MKAHLMISIYIYITYFHTYANSQKYFKGECCEEYCYSTDYQRTITRHGSSNSAYQLIRGNEQLGHSQISNCKPVRFWMLARHGTRLPEMEEIQLLPGLITLRNQIIENYEIKKRAPAKGALCEQDLNLLKNWSFDKNITEDKPEFLTVQGWNDLKMLANDYKVQYPEILDRPYDPKNFLFRHTGKQRTEASMKAFADGLFGEGSYSRISVADQQESNNILIPMNYCPDWKTDIGKVNDPGSELDKFLNSPIVFQMLADVSKRLGFERQLTFKEVLLIYNICAYETAWVSDKPSAWCSALTLEEAKIIEYEYDLFYQYRSGYGNTLNLNLPCEAVKDMLTRMNGNDEPLVTAYFTHSTMIQMFATALGLFRDRSQLTASNYESMDNRKWRASKMDPFAANYAVVKYNCTGNEGDSSLKVKFFLNQKRLQIDGCANGLCSLDYLTKKYEKFVKGDCSKIACTRSESTANLPNGSLVPTLAAMVFNWLH